jgi:hypothetical protein
VRNNSKVLEPEKLRPFFVVKDGALILDESFRHDPAFLEAKRLDAQRARLQPLRLYQLLRRLRAGQLRFPDSAPVAAALAARGDALVLVEPGLDESVFREPPNAAWHEAWLITERLLVAMHEETRARGAAFLVAVLSSPGVVYPDASMRSRYAEMLETNDLFYPENRIRKLGERHRFPVVALAPAMQGHADATGTYLHGFANSRLGFGHWNEAGHELGARLIAQHLCEASVSGELVFTTPAEG